MASAGLLSAAEELIDLDSRADDGRVNDPRR